MGLLEWIGYQEDLALHWLWTNSLQLVFEAFLLTATGCVLYLTRLARREEHAPKPTPVAVPPLEDAATAHEQLIAAQAQFRAAQAQTRAAEAQAEAARVAIRPVVLPALEWDRQTSTYELVLRNVGEGLAVQSAWSLNPTSKADLNIFLWPREIGLRTRLRGTVTQVLQKNEDWFQKLEPVPDGDYLLLVNHLDLSGNIFQSQMLAKLGGEVELPMQGFATLTAGEVQARRARLVNANDLAQVGLYPWGLDDDRGGGLPFILPKE